MRLVCVLLGKLKDTVSAATKSCCMSFQSLKGFSEPFFSEIWLHPLKAALFCPIQ